MYPSLLLTVLLTPFVIGANHFHGIAANNAKGNSASYTCKTQTDWNNVASTASKAGFKSLRVYAADCDAYNRASVAAKSHKLKVMAGIYQSGNTVAASMGQIKADAKKFKAAVKKHGAGLYEALTVTNEIGDSGANVMKAVKAVKSIVGGVYKGPISPVHTSYQYTVDHGFCGGSQVTANAQGFYDGNTASNQMGTYIRNQINALKKACPGKKIVITEAGWPTRGPARGPSKPGVANAIQADQQLNCVAKNTQIFLFEIQDSLWKTQNEWEKSYGLYNKKGIDAKKIYTTC